MIGDPPKPLDGSKKEGEPILSFEEFSRRDPVPRYNNFFLYFTRNPDYKKNLYYQRFVKEYPEIASTLSEKISKHCEGKYTSQSMKQFDQELYEAYKIMRSYGVSDRDLFA